MHDQISVARINVMHPDVRSEVVHGIEIAEEKLGQFIAIRTVQTLRTIHEQDILFEIGRTTKGANAKPDKPLGDIVTKARGGSSFHNYGLAFDFALVYDKDKNGTFESLSWDLVADMNRDGEADWKTVVTTFLDLGWNWGGNWHTLKDNPHLEKTFGYTWQDLYRKWQLNNFIKGTQYLNLSR